MKNTTELLLEFYNNTKNVDNIEDLWPVLQCEIYLKSTHKRCKYTGGHEFPDYKFLMNELCYSFEDMPGHIDLIVKEIERATENRELETIFISDRMPDGYVDLFEWER